jgi:hypothetical protein
MRYKTILCLIVSAVFASEILAHRIAKGSGPFVHAVTYDFETLYCWQDSATDRWHIARFLNNHSSCTDGVKIYEAESKHTIRVLKLSSDNRWQTLGRQVMYLTATGKRREKSYIGQLEYQTLSDSIIFSENVFDDPSEAHPSTVIKHRIDKASTDGRLSVSQLPKELPPSNLILSFESSKLTAFLSSRKSFVWDGAIFTELKDNGKWYSLSGQAVSDGIRIAVVKFWPSVIDVECSFVVFDAELGVVATDRKSIPIDETVIPKSLFPSTPPLAINRSLTNEHYSVQACSGLLFGDCLYIFSPFGVFAWRGENYEEHFKPELPCPEGYYPAGGFEHNGSFVLIANLREGVQHLVATVTREELRSGDLGTVKWEPVASTTDYRHTAWTKWIVLWEQHWISVLAAVFAIPAGVVFYYRARRKRKQAKVVEPAVLPSNLLLEPNE